MPIPTALTKQQFNTRWLTIDRPTERQAPMQWRHWLTDRGSLTQRLVKRSKGNFHVEVVRQYWGVPVLSERKALNMRCRERALIREVRLMGNNTAWVYARSIIPASTLTGRQRILAQMGTKPLGQMLFNDPTMQREPLQIGCLQLPNNEHAWARRSIFRLENKPLLVCEVFLPSLLRVE